MGSEAADYEQSATPKLALFSSFSSKVKEPPAEMLTPPIHRKASVPFQWEEAPGKPRLCTGTESKPNSTTSATSTVRCLELPPRLLLTEAKITNMPSPTNVLDGPYVGRSLSSLVSMRSSTNHQSWSKKLNKERALFGSTRWGSFKKNREVVEGSFDFLSSTDSSGHGSSGGGGGDHNGGNTKVKITKVTRRGSFLSPSNARPHLLTTIYESVKQAVPWKRRQEKMRKMSSSSVDLRV